MPRVKVLEIGGPDVLTYLEMMQTYGEVAGLATPSDAIPVPVLSPKLSSLWVGLGHPVALRARAGRWSRA